MTRVRILLAQTPFHDDAALSGLWCGVAALGAAVTQVSSSSAAVETVLAEEDGETPFSVVFVDVDAPAVSGVDAARNLRKCGFSGPIVAITSSPNDIDEEECLRAGFDDYMARPTTSDALARALRRHVRPPPRKSGVMPCVLVSEYSDDDEMMEIVRPYVKALPSRVAAVAAALESGDLPAMRSLALQLKGSAGGYGFPSITAAASAIDKAVLAGENPDKIRKRVEELSRLVSIARASVPPPSTRSEAFPVDPRGRDQQAGRTAAAGR